MGSTVFRYDRITGRKTVGEEAVGGLFALAPIFTAQSFELDRASTFTSADMVALLKVRPML
jgi:hypothetical protein